MTEARDVFAKSSELIINPVEERRGWQPKRTGVDSNVYIEGSKCV